MLLRLGLQHPAQAIASDFVNPITHPEDVLHMRRTADRPFCDRYGWSVLGAGRNQLPIAAMAAAKGGDKLEV